MTSCLLISSLQASVSLRRALVCPRPLVLMWTRPAPLMTRLLVLVHRLRSSSCPAATCAAAWCAATPCRTAPSAAARYPSASACTTARSPAPSLTRSLTHGAAAAPLPFSYLCMSMTRELRAAPLTAGRDD